MRREEEFFGGSELELVYIAKRLGEAKNVEQLFDQKELDYLVEPDYYMGGFLFRRVLTGAFFYVAEGNAEAARAALRSGGHKPYEAPGEGATAG